MQSAKVSLGVISILGNKWHKNTPFERMLEYLTPDISCYVDHSPEVGFSSEILSVIFKSSQHCYRLVPLGSLDNIFLACPPQPKLSSDQPAAAPVLPTEYAGQILFHQHLRTVRSSYLPHSIFKLSKWAPICV